MSVAEGARVQVLMSAYNGQRYIREQIESILAQKGVEVSLLIRDDGSTDRTIEVIEGIDSDRIRVIRGANIGYKASFITLLTGAEAGYDYYAFSDQDDVWLEDKLITAIRAMEAADGPSAYCSNPVYVNEGLEAISTCHSNLDDLPDGRVDPRWVIATGLYGLGCTFVWNREMMVLLQKGIGEVSEFPFAHDNYVSVAAPLLGTLVKDREGKILYRQHEKNTSGTKEQDGNRVRAVVNRIATMDREGYYLRKHLLERCGGMMAPEKKAVLEDSVRYVDSAGAWARMLIHSYAKGLNAHEKKKYYYRVLTKKL